MFMYTYILAIVRRMHFLFRHLNLKKKKKITLSTAFLYFSLYLYSAVIVITSENFSRKTSKYYIRRGAKVYGMNKQNKSLSSIISKSFEAYTYTFNPWQLKSWFNNLASRWWSMECHQSLYIRSRFYILYPYYTILWEPLLWISFDSTPRSFAFSLPAEEMCVQRVDAGHCLRCFSLSLYLWLLARFSFHVC